MGYRGSALASEILARSHLPDLTRQFCALAWPANSPPSPELASEFFFGKWAFSKTKKGLFLRQQDAQASISLGPSAVSNAMLREFMRDIGRHNI